MLCKATSYFSKREDIIFKSEDESEIHYVPLLAYVSQEPPSPLVYTAAEPYEVVVVEFHTAVDMVTEPSAVQATLEAQRNCQAEERHWIQRRDILGRERYRREVVGFVRMDCCRSSMMRACYPLALLVGGCLLPGFVRSSSCGRVVA
jgi:hypothetical protein